MQISFSVQVAQRGSDLLRPAKNVAREILDMVVLVEKLMQRSALH